MITKIVSGGQTGADRAALDWAISRGIPHGGWCPKGRKAEDGPIPAQYQLTETESADYPSRTEQNVKDSDGTVIIRLNLPMDDSAGSKLTLEFAEKHHKAHLIIFPGNESHGLTLRQFVKDYRIGTLNVAGPRAPSDPGIAEYVRLVLDEAFRDSPPGEADSFDELPDHWTWMFS